MSRPGTARIASALTIAAVLIAAVLGGCGGGSGGSPATTKRRAQRSLEASSRRAFVPTAGSIPPLLDLHNVYAAERPGLLSSTVRGDPALVYVPNSQSNTVDVISQRRSI